MEENRAPASEPGTAGQNDNEKISKEKPEIGDIQNSAIIENLPGQVLEKPTPQKEKDNNEKETVQIAKSNEKNKISKSKNYNSKKKGEEKQLGLSELFRYAEKADYFLIAIGTICAAIHGVSLPFLFIFFGDLTTELVSFGRYYHCHYDFQKCNESSFVFGNMSKIEFDERILEETGGRFDLDESIARYSIYCTIIGFVIWLACAIQVIAWMTQASNQVKKIRILFFESILRQNVAFFDINSAGELNTSLAEGMRKIQNGIGEKASMAVVQLTRFLACVIIGMIYSWKVTLILFVIIPFVAVFLFVLIKFMVWFSQMETNAYAEAGLIADEILSSVRTIVAFGAEKKEIKRYCDSFQQATGKGITKGFIQGSMVGIVYFILFDVYSLLLSVGSIFIIDEEIVIGNFLTAFFTLFIAAMSFMQGVACIDSINIAKGAAKKVFESIGEKGSIDSLSDEGHKPDRIEGKIVFENIKFSYPSRSNVRVINEISFEAKAGKTTAICGKSGCGKSTIVRLLQRFYDPQVGKITLDGVDIRTLNVGWLRDNIGVVSQNDTLFDTTIMENIRFGRSNVTDEQIIEAARKSNSFDFIVKLPNKFETVLGIGAAELSGGQRQRIAIARAIVGDPKILIFDEPSASLDLDSERLVQATANIVSKDTTSIVITHRIPMIRKAHKIIALENGKVAEQGTHHDLLNSVDGVYKNLVELHRLEFQNEDMDKPEGKETTTQPSEPIVEHRKVTSILTQPDLNNNVNYKEENIPQTSFGNILKFSKPEMPYILVGSFFALVSGAILPCFAILYAEFLRIFAFQTVEQHYRQVAYTTIFLLLLGVVGMLANTTQITCFFVSGEALTSRLRASAMQTILSQRMDFFDNPENNRLTLASRLAIDACRVKDCVGTKIGTVLQSICGLVVGLSIAFAYGWQLTLMTIVFVPFILAASVIQFYTLTQQVNQEERELAPAKAIISQYICNIKSVISLGREKQFLKNYKQAMEIPEKKEINKAYYHGISYGFSQCLVFIAVAVLGKFGAWLVQGGYMYFEDIFKVTLAVMFVVMSCGELSSIAPDCAAAITSASKMFKLLDNTPMKKDKKDQPKKLEAKKGRVEYEDIHFCFPAQPENEILKGLSLEIEPGTTTALVGESGCGKTTCLQLLEGFYNPTKGNVLYEDQNIKDFDISSMRATMGIVSQNTVLFNCSIADNIRFGDLSRNVTLEEIIYQATTADIHDFIQSLPDGYDTNVGPNGTQLSAGQRQRVAIARAMLRNPKLLLLDEATSSLDLESEVAVHNALEVARQGRTTIIVAQRYSAFKDADVIAVISDGVIVEIGTDAELLANKGLYLDLVNSQIYSAV